MWHVYLVRIKAPMKQERWPAMGRKRIFLIDDDRDFLSVCLHRLKSKGYEVESFQEPNEAVRVARSEKPDLVISDIKMPGLNGLEICDLLWNSVETRQTPIILITGYHDKRKYVESLHNNHVFFMEKPFAGNELLSTVQAALDSAYEVEEDPDEV